MKKFLKATAILMIVSMAAMSAAACSSAGNTSSSEADSNESSAVESSAADDTAAVETAAAESEDETNFGDYSVTIDSCRLAKDYQDADVVIVKYIFENVSDDDSASFYLTVDDNVYQDGVGLNEAYVLDDNADYSSDNQSKEIKQGASVEVEVAYELNDTTTDIDVELTPYLSWGDYEVTKTFSLQ